MSQRPKDDIFQTPTQRKATADDVCFVGTAFADLFATIGHVPPETGGLLLGSRKDFIVQKFIFDESGSRSYSSYDPDVNVLNKIVKKEWNENGLELIGWAHSHPRGVARLSGDYGNGTGDIGYLARIFQAMPSLSKFIVPIVFSSDDGPLTIHPYVAYRSKIESYRMGRLFVVSDYSQQQGKAPPGQKTAEPTDTAAAMKESAPKQAAQHEDSDEFPFKSVSISA